MRVFRSLLVVAMSLALAAPAAAQMKPAPPDPALAALPGKIVAIMNTNPGALQSLCSANTTIADEFPPYLWSGAGSCARYIAVFKGFLVQAKLTNLGGSITGTPYSEATGNNGYVSAHIHFTGTMAGKPAVDDGWWSIVTVKSGGTWKIASITWALAHH